MIFWTVQGLGNEVTVTSPDGDVYPFVITSPALLDLQLSAAPAWKNGAAPEDAHLKISAALVTAYRWTLETFGEAAP